MDIRYYAYLMHTCKRSSARCWFQAANVGIERLPEAVRNRIRGVLAEFGLVFGQSPKALRAVLADVLEDASNELSGTVRLVLQQAFEHWRELDERTTWCDAQVGRHVRSSADAKQAAKITGIGELTASAMVAAVADFKQFNNGAQMQNSRLTKEKCKQPIAA